MTKKARDCARCSHPADWHRHDDVTCHRTHAQPCETHSAPFRCLGYDCMAPGLPRTGQQGCPCPDFLEEDV